VLESGEEDSESTEEKDHLGKQNPNLKNINRVAKPPKTGYEWAPAKISKHWIQIQVEPANAAQIL